MRSDSAKLDARKSSHWDVLYSINHSLKTFPRCQMSSRNAAARLKSAGARKLVGDSPSNVKAYLCDWSLLVTALLCAVGPNTVTERWMAKRVIARTTKHKLRKGYLHIRVSFHNSLPISSSCYLIALSSRILH